MAKLGSGCGKVNCGPGPGGIISIQGGGAGVDGAGLVGLVYPAQLARHLDLEGTVNHEADLSASKPEARQQARLPCPYEDQGRPQGTQRPASPRTRAPDGEDRLEIGAMNAAGPAAESPERGGPGGYRFPPSSRIRSSRDIRALHARGKRKRTAHLDVFFAASPVLHCRFGAVVPKHGRRIVDRNRLRRRLREVGRREILPRLREGGHVVDLLVRARPEAYGVPYDTLRRELVELVEASWSGKP